MNHQTAQTIISSWRTTYNNEPNWIKKQTICFCFYGAVQTLFDLERITQKHKQELELEIEGMHELVSSLMEMA